MKRIYTLITMLLFVCVGAWAQITVTPGNGVYWKNGAATSDAYAPLWKSIVKAADGTTALLELESKTGMNTSTGDIFSNQTYTLRVPEGYYITSYTINGTVSGPDITITPSGESGTVVTSGNCLATPLKVTVLAQSTSFALASSGDAHFTDLALVVNISKTRSITIANTSTGNLPSAFGSFSGQTYTSSAASGLAGVTVTASSGLTIYEATVNVDSYGKCFRLVTAAAATDYTVTMTAPAGYIITGYTLGCSANTKDAVHTLTSADGTVSVVASAPPYNSPTGPKPFVVTGLKEQSTHFTISTANKANTLYLPTFFITIAKEEGFMEATYKVIYESSEKASSAGYRVYGDSPSLQTSLKRDFCTYTYYSDEDCTTPLDVIASPSTNVYAKCTFNPPFTVSSSFGTATWYNLKIKDANYMTYVADGSPNVTLPTTNAGNSTTRWAFFGNPYDGLQLVNYAAGSDKVLGSESAASDGNTGANTHATMNNAGSKTYERWFPKSSTHYSNGFFLFNGEGYALNQRSTDNVAYWTGGYDAGSTFRVENALAESDLASKKTDGTYIISDLSNLDKPGFPTTAAYNTFRTAVDGYESIIQWEENFESDLATLKNSVVYPNGTYYIKNRNTGCYAFITDDGELVPRIKIDNSVSHTNNNYMWTVTSDKEAGTCSIVSSLYSTVPFAKGDNDYSNITSSNRTVITTLSTELFSTNNGTSGGFYLNGAHNNNTYNSAGDGNSHVVSWNYTSSPGSQWIFEPADLPEARWTITVNGLEEGNHDSVILSDGTIVNAGTGTVYLSETPTTDNITQNDITGYTILDGSITINSEAKTITVTYSPSYEVLVTNYYNTERKNNVLRAGQLGYPKTTSSSYTTLKGLLETFTVGHEYTASDYSNLRSYYTSYINESDVAVPTAGKFYRIKSSALHIASQPYLIGENHATQTARAAFSTSEGSSAKSVWYFDGSHLLNFSNGYYAVNNNSFLGVATSPDATATSISFEQSGKKELGALSIKFNGNRYLYTNAGLYSDAAGVKNDNGYSFNVEEVTELPLTVNQVGDNYYATLYMPVPVSITGSTAYTLALSDDNKWLVPTAVEGNIPANQPVLLVGTSSSVTATVESTAGSKVDTPLEGTLAAKAVEDETDYFLGRYRETEDDPYEVGFFKWTGTLKGFRAYLPATEVAASRGFAIKWSDDDVTGIRALENGKQAQSNGVYYDLSGRRVQNPQHGLYIVNGKKVVIK